MYFRSGSRESKESVPFHHMVRGKSMSQKGKEGDSNCNLSMLQVVDGQEKGIMKDLLVEGLYEGKHKAGSI